MMNEKLLKSAPYIVAVGLLSIGIGVIYYGFELVSVPHVNEYSEEGLTIAGLLTAIGGIVTGIVYFRKSKQHSKNA